MNQEVDNLQSHPKLFRDKPPSHTARLQGAKEGPELTVIATLPVDVSRFISFQVSRKSLGHQSDRHGTVIDMGSIVLLNCHLKCPQV